MNGLGFWFDFQSLTFTTRNICTQRDAQASEWLPSSHNQYQNPSLGSSGKALKLTRLPTVVNGARSVCTSHELYSRPNRQRNETTYKSSRSNAGVSFPQTAWGHPACQFGTYGHPSSKLGALKKILLGQSLPPPVVPEFPRPLRLAAAGFLSSKRPKSASDTVHVWDGRRVVSQYRA